MVKDGRGYHKHPIEHSNNARGVGRSDGITRAQRSKVRQDAFKKYEGRITQKSVKLKSGQEVTVFEAVGKDGLTQKFTYWDDAREFLDWWDAGLIKTGGLYLTPYEYEHIAANAQRMSPAEIKLFNTLSSEERDRRTKELVDELHRRKI